MFCKTRTAAAKAAAQLRHTGALVGAPTMPHYFSTPLNAVRFCGVPPAPFLVCRE
jgi:hypothetical protein